MVTEEREYAEKIKAHLSDALTRKKGQGELAGRILGHIYLT